MYTINSTEFSLKLKMFFKNSQWQSLKSLRTTQYIFLKFQDKQKENLTLVKNIKIILGHLWGDLGRPLLSGHSLTLQIKLDCCSSLQFIIEISLMCCSPNCDSTAGCWKLLYFNHYWKSDTTQHRQSLSFFFFPFGDKYPNYSYWE